MSPVLDEYQVQFNANGYAVLAEWLSFEELGALQEVCDRLLCTRRSNESKSLKSKPSNALTIPSSRYFLAHASKTEPAVRKLLFGDKMRSACRAFLGERCILYHDHFVVKLPLGGAAFEWHQDSAYDGFDHKPYLSCWLSLDDVSVENGTLVVAPLSENGGDGLKPHERWPSGELAVLRPPTSSVALTLKAGSAVFMSSRLMHYSGINRSDRARRAYVVFVTPEVMHRPGSQMPIGGTEIISDSHRG